MKRRSFLGALAAVVAAPKALMALKPKPVARWFTWGASVPAGATMYLDANSPFNEVDANGNVTLMRDLSGHGNHARVPDEVHPGVGNVVAFDHVLSDTEMRDVHRRLGF